MHYGLDDLKDFDILAFLPILLPFLLVGLLLVLIALIDLYRHRNVRKNILMWTIIIIFINLLGPVLYFVLGRKEGERQ